VLILKTSYEINLSKGCLFSTPDLGEGDKIKLLGKKKKLKEEKEERKLKKEKGRQED